MLGRIAFLVVVFVLAGCGGMTAAPVGESRAPTPVEAALPGTAVPAVASADRFYFIKRGDTLYSIAKAHGVTPREMTVWNNLEDATRIAVGQRLRVSAPGAAPMPAPLPGAAEVRPIASGGAVVGRPLDGSPSGAAVPAAGHFISPAPTFAPGGESLKRSPKGGKLPYSVENLALLKAQTVAPVPPGVAPAAPAAQPETPVAPPPAAVRPPVAAASGDIDWAWPAPGKLLANFTEGGAGQEANKGIDIAGKQGDPVLAAAAGKVVYSGSGLRGYGNLVIVRHNAMFLSAYAHNSRILVKEGQAVVRGQKIAEMGSSDADQTKLHFEVRQQGKPVDPLKFLPPR